MTYRSLLAMTVLAACGGGDDGGTGGSCPALTKPHSGGTQHEYAEQSEADGTVQVWKAADSPHFVSDYDLMDIELTIEPCSYVIMEASMFVSRSGKIIANGTADRPIVFEAADADSPWSTIESDYVTPTGYDPDTQGGYIQMSYVTLSGGGVTTTGSLVPMLRAHGNDFNNDGIPAVPHLDLQHVTVQNGSTYGVQADRESTFSATSTDLTITGQGTAAMLIGIRALGDVPAGKYTGNASDSIDVLSDVPAITGSLSAHDRGVPYMLGDPGNSSSRFTVGVPTGAPATLTIDPGVTLGFRPQTVLEVDATGTLIAKGTAEKPIHFTSSATSPAAGDWPGIQFLAAPTAASALDHVEVAYAGQRYQSLGQSCRPDGSFGDTYGAITFAEQPATSPVTNSSIHDSLTDGIARVWQGAPMDLSATNMFASIEGCAQSYPYPADGECPATVPCD